jgi:hypothetical protein
MAATVALGDHRVWLGWGGVVGLKGGVSMVVWFQVRSRPWELLKWCRAAKLMSILALFRENPKT